VTLYFSPPARVEVGPHYTVSQSESGFERIMQSVQVTLAWPVGRGASEAAVRLEIRKDPEGTAAPHRA
jgi:alpha-amylase